MPVPAYNNPIWVDTYANLGQVSSVEYFIYLDDVVIFSGIAYRKPGDSYLFVRINDICAEYMTHPVPAFNAGTIGHPTPMVMALDYSKTFRVQTRVLSGENYIYVDIGDFTFTNNWSFDANFVQGSVLSFPIDHRISPYQMLLYTQDSEDASLTVQYETISDLPVDFNADFNADFRIELESGQTSINALSITGPRVFTLNIGSLGGDELNSITIGNNVWKVVKDCKGFVLHYINAYGGWDSLLVGGNTVQEDAVKHYERGRQGNNSNRVLSPSAARTRENYLNSLTHKYVFHTALLTTDEAGRMHHILNSPLVFLEDLSGSYQELYPIVLTGTSTRYATYKNNGNKLIEYTIEAELAEDRIRR